MRNLKRVLSLALALVMVLGMMVITTSAADFTDAEEITYEEAVDVISAIGVITGYPDGTFQPEGNLTREQGAALICYLLMGKDKADKLTGSGLFSDVAADRWSAGEIEYCVNLGYIAGRGDGTFDPAGELTGIAYGKLLLCALGYDAKIEGYEGENWAAAILSDMVENGLDIDGVDMSKVLTREAAAQMTLQALECTMVKYDSKGTDITIGDTSINTGASTAEPVLEGTYASYNNGNDNTLQFVEKYFKNLKLVAGSDDAFARPGDYAWELKGETVYNQLYSASKTYTNSFTKKVKEDLEKQKFDFTNAVVYYNGNVLATQVGGNTPATVADLYVTGSGAAINGYTVELYNTDNNAKTIERVVVSEGYFAIVGKTTPAKGQTPASLTIDVYEAGNMTNNLANAATTMTITDDPDKTTDLFDTLAAYEKDDAIIVYCANLWEQNPTDESYILDVADVTGVTGTIAKVNVGAKNNDTTVVIDGTTYKMNSQCVGGVALNAGLKGTLYLDAQGYAIGWVGESNQTKDTYAFVLDVNNKVTTGIFGGTKTMAKLLLADGSIVEVEYKMDNDATLTKGTDTAVKYSVKDDVYTVEVVTPKTNVTSIKTGVATLASGAYADSKTVFIVRGGEAPKYTYTVYTGINNVPSMTVSASETIIDTGVHAAVVYVSSSIPTAATAEKAVYVTSTGAKEVKELAADGKTVLTYYVQNAVVDGVITTINTDTGAYDGVYASITTDDDGIATLTNKVTAADKIQALSDTSVKYTEGVLNIGIGFYGYSAEAVCYVTNGNTGAIEAGDITKLDDSFGGWYTLKDGIVTGLYLVD